MKKRSSLILLLIFFIALVFAPSAYLQGVFNDFTQVLAVFGVEHPVLGPLVFMGLAAVSVLLGPFSSVPLVPSAVAIWGIIPTLAFLLSGWLAGSAGAYALGRYAGQPLVSRIVGPRQLEKWFITMERHLNFIMMLIFRLAVPSETGYIFGLIGYRFKQYMLITFLAEFPFALLAVFAGDAFADTSWASFWSLLIIWVGIIGCAYIMLVRYLHHEHQ